MKTIGDFVALIESGARPVVQFGAKIGDQESYAESGMRARVLSARRERSDTVAIRFAYPDFEAHNRPLESTCYYDKQGNPTWTARQAGYYHDEEDLYFSPDDDLAGKMQLLADEAAQLYQEFAGAKTGQTYTAWLESQVLALRAEKNSA